MGILESINSPKLLRQLPEFKLPELCAEIREFLIDSLAETGGHLASNLGAVELTVALNRVYDAERDRIVFDVGHQSYTHKLLTGRRDGFDKLRQYRGLSGFPKPSESEADAFATGHASTSVSVALGMATARTRLGEDYDVAALIGDGALTGGLAYEGLCNVGQSGEPIVIVLNDNAMSIDSNVGGMAKLLSALRVKPGYFEFKRRYRETVGKMPSLYKTLHRAKESVKGAILQPNLFDEMGLYYLGPVDGHDVGQLIAALSWARELRMPVLLHVITKKGKGYHWAELHPEKYHSAAPFDRETGHMKNSGRSFSDAFGEGLTALAENDEKIVAITAAMCDGTGLSGFSAAYPDRFFDVGIAEGHAVTAAAGMAKQGITPVVSIYSSFLQRAYDMLIHDVSLQKLHVVFGVDRAGLVGGDGETHHGSFDVAYLGGVPGMTVFCPASFRELKTMLRRAIYDTAGPVALRYPRGGEGEYTACAESDCAVLQSGADITLVAYGTMINPTLEASRLLEEKGVSAEVIKLGVIAPLDAGDVIKSVKKTGRLIVAEDVCAHGSVGERLLAAMSGEMLFRHRLLNLGSGIAVQGSVPELLAHYGLDGAGILNAARELMNDGKAAT